MPITRHTQVVIAAAAADDHGNVELTTRASTVTITPDEAKELSHELRIAASKAIIYRTEEALTK